MNGHELGFTTFLAEPSQRRLRKLLELGPKRRPDARALLDHAVTLDQRYCELLSGSGASAEAVEKRLRALGSPDTVFLISADDAVDGKGMSLADGLRELSQGFGGFMSCIPGQLGYFQYEDMRAAYILKK